MFIIDDLLLWLPLKGLLSIAEKVKMLAEKETSYSTNMKNFYLYALIKYSDSSQKKISSPGVSFATPPYIITEKKISAIVSDFTGDKVSKEEIENRLKSDLEWTRENVYRHHQVIEESSKKNPIIPMKFATILKEDDMHRILHDDYKKFDNLLNQLSGKEEWGLKVYLNYEKTKDNILGRNKASGKSTASGRLWYEQKKNELEIENRIEETLEKAINETVANLENVSEKASYSEPLPQSLTGREEIMVFNGAFLIDKSQVHRFQKEAKRIDNKIKKKGFILEISGPWPPYNFVGQKN